MSEMQIQHFISIFYIQLEAFVFFFTFFKDKKNEVQTIVVHFIL